MFDEYGLMEKQEKKKTMCKILDIAMGMKI